jgi:hypothetical protein
MPETPEYYMVNLFRRVSRFVARGLLTPQEFINKAFDTFATLDRVYPSVIPSIWELIPEPTRGNFSGAVRSATAPRFRWYPFYTTGVMTEEYLRQNAELNTARVAAWALAFVLFLESRD